jgi:chromosome segregation ATPase
MDKNFNITREQLSYGINKIVDDDNYISLNDLINFFYDKLTFDKKILNDEISELNDKISELNDDINDLNSSLLSTGSENFKELKRYAESSYEIKNQNKIFKNKINQLNDEISDLKSSLVSIESENKIEKNIKNVESEIEKNIKNIESDNKIKNIENVTSDKKILNYKSKIKEEEQEQEQEQEIINNIIGGNLNNLPKNYIYNINGIKKLNISCDGINFTTCTDQNIINNAYNRKILYNRKKRKSEKNNLYNDNIDNNNENDIVNKYFNKMKSLSGKAKAADFFKDIVNK